MADRDGKRVGGVVRCRIAVEAENRAHHPLDLCLLSASVAAHRLLDARRRVLRAPHLAEGARDEHRAARLPDGECDAGVGADERLLEHDRVGSVPVDELGDVLEDRPQAKLRELVRPRLPPPVVERPQAPFSLVDDAVAARCCSRVNAEDLHAQTLGPSADVPPVRRWERTRIVGDDAALLDGDQEHRVRQNLSIGRSPGNDIVLASKTVSRDHAVLTYSDGRWCIEDRGSANGTFVNGEQIPFGVPRPLRHGDRVQVGSETLVFSWPAHQADPDRTDELVDAPEELLAQLSPLQVQVVRALCGAWLAGSTLDELPSNEQIAAQLGTPGAAETVKAALRRVYAKAGIAELPAHAKRRALCRIARQRGWI